MTRDIIGRGYMLITSGSLRVKYQKYRLLLSTCISGCVSTDFLIPDELYCHQTQAQYWVIHYFLSLPASQTLCVIFEFTFLL